jgi:hypothetical protein
MLLIKETIDSIKDIPMNRIFHDVQTLRLAPLKSL